MNLFKQTKFSNLKEAVDNSDNCKILHIPALDFNLADKGSEFSKLQNLKELDIQADPIMYYLPNFDLPPTIGQLSKLKVLSLLNIPLKLFPSWITDLSNLEYLMIRGTDVTNIPESISQLKKLETLRVENCALTSLPVSLKEMSNLKMLKLCDTRLTDLNPNFFPKGLKHLDFSGTSCYKLEDLDKLRIGLKNTKVFPAAVQKINH